MLNQPTIDTFLKMIESLRRYQRAELLDEENNNIIDRLYTDPIEGDFVLKSMLLPQTTLLIGRKGTGKSTIIGRFQHEIRKLDDRISIYLDVRTIYEQTQGTYHDNPEQNVLSKEEYQRYLLHKHFLKKIIEDIKKEINNNLFTNKIWNFFTGKGKTKEKFEIELEKIFNEISTPKFEDITEIKKIVSKDVISSETEKEDSNENETSIGAGIKVGKEGVGVDLGKIQAKAKDRTLKKNQEINNEEYSTFFKRYFNIIDFKEKIKILLESIGIKQVFICLDDASELDKDSLDIFVRTLVAPLHNAADGFFKFKISFYPGRDHTPNIDRTKLEIINLDYYNLYQSSGIDKVESFAISYTKRLLETRFKYYFGEDVNLEDFFDTKIISIEEYYRIIFQASSNVPRNIGKLLWYSARRSIFQGNKINKRVLQEAAGEHYIQEIKPILYKNEYIQYKNYGEKFEREHLKKLLESILNRAKDNKRHIGSSQAEIFKIYTPNTAPSNYLYFPPMMEEFLTTLEMNFFLSKFAQQKDKGTGSGKNYVPPKEVSIYTINYGLCQDESIIVDEKSDRKFRTERIFDYTELIKEWIESSQIIRCTNCNAIHSFEKLDAIKQFGMLCDKCFNKTCRVETVAVELPDNAPVQIKEKDFQVINVLKIENGLTTPQIASELDCSYQSVNQRIRYDRFLMQSKFIEKNEDSTPPKYYITDGATQIFFND